MPFDTLSKRSEVPVYDRVELSSDDLVHVADRWVKHDSKRSLVVLEQVVGEYRDFAAFNRVYHFELIEREVCDLEPVLVGRCQG